MTIHLGLVQQIYNDVVLKNCMPLSMHQTYEIMVNGDMINKDGTPTRYAIKHGLVENLKKD